MLLDSSLESQFAFSLFPLPRNLVSNDSGNKNIEFKVFKIQKEKWQNDQMLIVSETLFRGPEVSQPTWVA